MFLTVVGCFDVQNVAFTNQSGEDTNQIGRFEVLDVTLDKVSCTLTLSTSVTTRDSSSKLGSPLAAPSVRQCSNMFDIALGLHYLCIIILWTSGRTTAKWMQAFTKFDCMCYEQRNSEMQKGLYTFLYGI